MRILKKLLRLKQKNLWKISIETKMKRDRLPLRQKNLGQNSMEEKKLGKISIETKNFESGFQWDKKIWDKVPDLELEIFWKNFPLRQNFLRKGSIET